MTNSIRLPSAIITRWPADDAGRAEPGGDPADLVLELGPGQAAAAGLDEREPVGALRRGHGDQVGDVAPTGRGGIRRMAVGILPHPATRAVHGASACYPAGRDARRADRDRR